MAKGTKYITYSYEVKKTIEVTIKAHLPSTHHDYTEDEEADMAAVEELNKMSWDEDDIECYDVSEYTDYEED